MGNSIADAMKKALPEDRVRTDDALLQERRHDYWVLSHLDDIQDRPAPVPACVVQPTCIEEVVAIVNACRASKTPIIPFGLGSGVCGGVVANPESVLLDMSEMNRTRFIDETNLLASFDAGKNGGEAEAEVAKQGLTMGHWPQSIDVSTVGGWIATRASGQFSTGYGNIEDIVYSVEAVLPNGEIMTAGKAPRAAAGPDLRHILLGSEGTMGIITGVTLSMRRRPEMQDYSAFFCKGMQQGFEAQRVVVQSGWQPVVMRQYDETEASRLFPDHSRSDRCLFIAVHEGPAARVEVEKAGVADIAETLDLEAAPVVIVKQWLEDRNHVPTWQTFLENGIVLDTIEISAGWDVIGTIYDDVTAALRDTPGMMAGTAHSSHVYRTGLNLYFTFVARPEDSSDMADTYRNAWKTVLETTSKHGGGIAHHHGIGRVRKNFMALDLGEGGVGLLRTIKQAVDPDNIMNPGVLIPDA